MSSPFEPPQFNTPSLPSNENLFQVNLCGKTQYPSHFPNSLPSCKIQKVNQEALTNTKSKINSKTKGKTRQTKTKSKTKAKQTKNTVTKKTLVTLPREELLVTSRAQFDEFVISKTGGRDLSPEERKEVARQRQLIKNRNTAAASRQRKKEYQKKLETQHDELVKSQQELQERVASMEAENAQMKKEMSYFESFIQANPVVSNLWKRAKSTKKTFSMASDALKTAAKYILLFVLFVQLMFATYIGDTQVPFAPKVQPEWAPTFDVSMDDVMSNFPTPLDTEPCSFNFNPEQSKSEFGNEFANLDEPYVPTLMPPKENYEDLPRFDFDDTQVNEETWINGTISSSCPPASISISNTTTEENVPPIPDFLELDFPYLDELLANANGTLVLPDPEKSEFWDDLFSAFIPDTPLESPCLVSTTE